MQRDDLQAKIVAEQEEEESWKRELEDITEFSRTAEEKYTNYVQVSGPNIMLLNPHNAIFSTDS